MFAIKALLSLAFAYFFYAYGDIFTPMRGRLLVGLILEVLVTYSVVCVICHFKNVSTKDLLKKVFGKKNENKEEQSKKVSEKDLDKLTISIGVRFVISKLLIILIYTQWRFFVPFFGEFFRLLSIVVLIAYAIVCVICKFKKVSTKDFVKSMFIKKSDEKEKLDDEEEPYDQSIRS